MAAQNMEKDAIRRTISDDESVAAEYSAFDIPWASGIATEKCKCNCCGLVEECSAVYIQRVRDLHCGRFVCGLCAEAVNEEVTRLMGQDRIVVSMKDALRSHMSVCAQFNSPERTDPTMQTITAVVAMSQILLRRMNIGSPDHAPIPRDLKRNHSRSKSCIPPIGPSRGFSSTVN